MGDASSNRNEFARIETEIVALRAMVSDLFILNNPMNNQPDIPRQVLSSHDVGSTTPFSFSFKTVLAENCTAIMIPGSVHLGPDTHIDWNHESFIDENTLISPTPSNTEWYVWLVIDVHNLTVTWHEGPSMTALNSTDQLTKMNWPIVFLTVSWTEDTPPVGTIESIQHLQCGDVVIPRASG